ncbi:hypothetical protein [Ferrovibrio sp.]|uniref:hypothetical protein n=1 Tax=Ferrovibrio sp. TaxID=1917215 RepID=UPI000CB95E1D|nr:hypothetical protein [Ferrovibrio sp.]PJI37827.1 MAG: hypothetical protein CTR53_18685 [Ferrovibrio sp.]
MATAANTNRTRRRPRSPEAELSDLRNQVMELGNDFGTLVSRAKNDGTALAEAELAQLQSRILDLGSNLKDHGREAIDRIEETVQEHPAGSLLAAFAAGALLTVLLRR